MKGYYNQVIAILKAHGFAFLRQKGSHQRWFRGSLVVTVSTNCKSRYTANDVMKQAGIAHRF